MRLRVLNISCLGLLGALSAPAHAQEGPRVLAIAPRTPLPEWTRSLAIELAGIGGRMVIAPPPPSTDHTPGHIRAATHARQADAAVWLAADQDAVHVLTTRNALILRAPLTRTASPRTIALVAASLLEEALRPAMPPSHHDPGVTTAILQRAAAPPPQGPPTNGSTPPHDSATAPHTALDATAPLAPDPARPPLPSTDPSTPSSVPNSQPSASAPPRSPRAPPSPRPCTYAD